jgi:OTU domain-containing protein 6
MSTEEIEASHKKALKSLEGEKRAAVKKAKGMKGKKGKQALAAVEEDFSAKLKALEGSYQEKLAALTVESLEISADSPTDAEKPSVSSSDDDKGEIVDEEAAARERKRAKAKKKRDRQKEKEARIEQKIEEENANAGPGLRKIELEQIRAVLTPLKLKVSEVDADGHCLYRAVGAQTGTNYMAIRKYEAAGEAMSCSYSVRNHLFTILGFLSSVIFSFFCVGGSELDNIGSLCADTLLKHQDEFAPFCEYTDDVSTFDEYLSKVRNSAEWGGHLELRALGIALNRPIYVYSVQSGAKPLAIHEDSEGEETGNEPILLSYHLHYYALGEHYNQVIKE